MKRFFAWLMYWLYRFAQMIKGRQPGPSAWFDSRRIWKETSSSGQVLMLRHTAYPFPDVWDERDEGFEGLARIANGYLAAVWERLGAPAIWLEDIASSVGETRVQGLTAKDAQSGLPYLRWLPFASPDPSTNKFEPRGSAWLTRRDAAGRVIDRTAILIGVLSVARQGNWVALYGHQGVRVVIHVAGMGETGVNITGITQANPGVVTSAGHGFSNGDRVYLSGMVGMAQLNGRYIKVAGVTADTFQLIDFAGNNIDTTSYDAYTSGGTAARAGNATEVRITGLTTTLPQWKLQAYTTWNAHVALSADWQGLRRSELARRYATTPVEELRVGEPGWAINLPGDGAPPPSTEHFTISLGKRLKDQVLVVARVPDMAVVANANVQADVFTQDLMARYGATKFRDTRPGRTWEDADWLGQGLAPVRDTVQLDLKPAPGGSHELENPGGNPNVRVTYSRYSAQDRKVLATGVNEDNAKQVTAAELKDKNRTDATSSVTAFYHANDLFERLKRWKLDLAELFRFVQLPLLMRYRYGMLNGPGKDGRTVNAMVTIKRDSSPWQIEARFGLADLRASPERSPLGLVCDPRWVWHEFGHVLLAGSVGELEFRFGHSAGDALAAILFDPSSKLAGDSNWRGVTFPWVTQPRRRHDRKVEDGWGWSGALYQRERFFTDEGHCAKAGYWAEQILSSTLFRLYRGLGGDTEQAPGVPDVNARLAAAEYSAYLIARAIGILGDAPSIPACTPDQFASALIDADRGTSKFDDGSARPRIGGAARKVIRWAFQQQGLYATSNDGFPTARPGDPEDVDLHIADLRNQGTPCAPGTYAPIKGSEWHADPAAIWVRRNPDNGPTHEAPRAGAHNWIYFEVQNLGPLRADQIRVYAWAAEIGAGGLTDPALKWKLVGSVGPATIAGGAKTKLGPIDWDLTAVAQNKRLALLVAANCPADQANVDRSTDLPCAFPHDLDHNGAFKIDCPIDQLVTYDNNLGLRDLTTKP